MVKLKYLPYSGEGRGNGLLSIAEWGRAGSMICREVNWPEGYTEAWHKVCWALGGGGDKP